MNAILEIAVIAFVVGVAALFVALRVFKALRGGRPSCCSDAEDPEGLAAQPDGNLRPRPSYCAGCTGCQPRL